MLCVRRRIFISSYANFNNAQENNIRLAHIQKLNWIFIALLVRIQHEQQHARARHDLMKNHRQMIIKKNVEISNLSWKCCSRTTSEHSETNYPTRWSFVCCSLSAPLQYVLFYVQNLISISICDLCQSVSRVIQVKTHVWEFYILFTSISIILCCLWIFCEISSQCSSDVNFTTWAGLCLVIFSQYFPTNYTEHDHVYEETAIISGKKSKKEKSAPEKYQMSCRRRFV